MDTQSVWEILAQIPIGTIVAWVVVIAAIIAALCTGIFKTYKAFSKYRELKEENERYRKLVEYNSETLKKIDEKFDKMNKQFEAQRKINYKQVRFDIIRTCVEAINTGQISANKYKSLIEMYDEYVEVFSDMKPNGYVHNQINRVKDPQQVKIVGTLDE